ncbi:hypothetical protein PCYB_123850, partial [Plasmodium cynomolgi strain B]
MEEIHMSVFNLTIYVNKNLSKSLLLSSPPFGRPREEVLPYGMSTQQGNEGVLKIEVQEVRNYEASDYRCESNQGGMSNTGEQEHTRTGRTRKGSPHFYLNKVILKWVYCQQGVLYEYAISDPMDVTLKKDTRQEGGRLSSVTTAYVGMSTWYLLPEHAIFIHDLYLLYCQHERKNSFARRSKLIRRNKKRRHDTGSGVTHSNCYITMALKNCHVRLFCISRNFDIYWRVCRYIGHGDMKPPREAIKETPPLASISVSCNLVYLLNPASKGVSPSRRSRTYRSYFYLSNVAIQSDCQDEEEKPTEGGEAPKQPFPFHQNSIKKVMQSRWNQRNLVKYQLQVDIKSQIAFVSADQVRSLHELQEVKNEELNRSEHTLCLCGRLSLLYFDPLKKENIKRCNFVQLHLDAHQVKVRKRTHSNKTFKFFHFEKRLSSHQESPLMPDVFSESFYKTFRAGKRSHPWGDGAGRYFTVEATVRNVDEGVSKVVGEGADRVVGEGADRVVGEGADRVVGDTTGKVMNDTANEVMKDRADRPPRGARKYNSETSIRGRGLRMIYKTNDFFFFLNKYLLTDVCYLFSARRAMEEAAAKEPAASPAEGCRHSESDYLHFREEEVADPFVLRNSIARKRQLGNTVTKIKKTQTHNTGEKKHHEGYKVKRSELKTLPISLNKYQLVLNKVIIFVPSMINNRNFIVAQNDVVVRNHIKLKKKKKIEILDKTSYKLLQDVFLENVLSNNFEYVQGRHYKGRASLYGKSLHGEVLSRDEVNTNRGRRVRDLDVRLYFMHMHVELQNEHLDSRMSYLFCKFVFARTVRYLGEEHIVTYVKGIAPLVMNTFYEYPYDILMCHRKLNPRKYAKWLARMKKADVEHDEQSFNSLLKTKLKKYARIKKRERTTFHVVYKRVRRDHLGCDVTNDVDIKMERIYLNTDVLQLFNLYIFYFVDDRNVHLSRVEKVLPRQGRAKLCARAPPPDQQFEEEEFAEEELPQKGPPQKGHSAHTRPPHQTSMETLKRESIKNAPAEEPLDTRILTAYQRMVTKLTSSDFSNYNSIVRSNNVYTVRIQIRHAHFSFNFLFYENVRGVRRLPFRGTKQKGKAKEATSGSKKPTDGQSHPFGLTYRGSLDFHLSFNLQKSIHQKFAKKAKYIFFNNYVVDNFLQNRLNKSGELENFLLHTVNHIGDEMNEHVYFRCNIERKNYLYLINRGGSYCISRNINLCVSARNDKVIYFNRDEKSVKMEGLQYREVFLDKLFGRRSSPFGGEDEKMAQEKKIICDVQLVDHNGVDIRKGNSNGDASTNSVDVGKSFIRVETPCTKPRYIDVHVKQANVVIKLGDFFYLVSKLHELLHIMSRHEEVNVCLFRLSKASAKRKERHKCKMKRIKRHKREIKTIKRHKCEIKRIKRHECKIKRIKFLNYSTFIVRVILSSLDLHLFESVYYTKLKRYKKSKISHVHVQANYEYLTCHRKNETLFKRHQSDLSLEINFAKNNIYEEFTRGIRLKIIYVRTRNQSNFIIILEDHGVNIFLTKNAFRSVLRLYEEANDWRNYRAREVTHQGWNPDEGADQVIDVKQVGRCAANRNCETHNEASRAQSRRIQKRKRNYEEGESIHNCAGGGSTHGCSKGRGTHNCAEGEDKAGGSTFVRRKSSKLGALLRSKHFNFAHDDYTVVNRTYERVATYRSSEISHSPFDRSNPVHMLYMRRMKSFVFPSLTSKWRESGELVLSCEHSLYIVSSTVCIYNDTNHDMVLLINNHRIVLFAKRHTYLSRHRCNIKRDHFMLVLFYKKGLFISSKLSLHDFKSANIVGKEKLHQFMTNKRVRESAQFVCAEGGRSSPNGGRNSPNGGRSYPNGGDDSSEASKPLTREFPPREKTPPKDLINQYSLYNHMKRKIAKMILNDEWLSDNWSTNDDRIWTNLTLIQNEKTDDGSLYLNIGSVVKMRNTLPIRVHYRSGNTSCSVKAFSSKEVFSSDLDLNVSCNTLKGTKLNITYDKRLGFSPLGDPSVCPAASQYPQNSEPKEEHTKGEFPPQGSSAQVEGFNSGKQRHDHEGVTHKGVTHKGATHEGVTHEGVTHEGVAHEGVAHEGVTHEGVTHYYANAIKWNSEIVVTCHTLICLYADELKIVEVNKKRIYFAHSSRRVSGTAKCDQSSLPSSTPLTFPLKRLNLYLGMYNELVSSIRVGSCKISGLPINSFKEVSIPTTHKKGRECSSYYAVEYTKNCLLGSYSRYSRVSSLLIIYPRFIMLNQTNYNIVMSCSCSSDSMVYTFERRSRSVLNLLESDAKRSFFFQIGKYNLSNDYVFMSGGIDITKEGSYILCFTKKGSPSSSLRSFPQSGAKNHLNNFPQNGEKNHQHNFPQDGAKNHLNNFPSNGEKNHLHNFPQNGEKNHLHKSGKSEKIKTQFVHLKIRVIEGSKLKEKSGNHWGSNSFFVIISNHRTKKNKLKKYLTKVNSPNVLMHSMERKENKNTLMHIYHFIKEEEQVKKLYVYNDMDIDLIFDIFHFSEFVYMIKKVVEEESTSSKRIHGECTSNQKGSDQTDEQKRTVDFCTSQGKHNRPKESFFRNIFLVESSDNNSSGDDLIQKEQQANYDTAKLTKHNVSYISNHVSELKKYVQENLRQLRRIGRKSVRLFPLRKNKNVKNSFLVVYPWQHSRRYQIVKLSLKRKKHVLSFARDYRSGTPDDPPLVVILETFILSKKGKKKILVKISQHVDNIVHIRGKNKNVTLVESKNSYKFIFTNRRKETPEDGLHLYLSIEKTIRINIFSTVLVEGDGEGKLSSMESGQKGQEELGGTPNDRRLYTMTHSSQRGELFKKKKNSHLCTLMLRNTSMFVGLHKNKPNVILLSLGDAILMEFASAEMKKVLCKYDMKEGLHNGEGDMTPLVTSEGVHTDHLSRSNYFARLHMEYEISPKKWNIKKFELALSP